MVALAALYALFFSAYTMQRHAAFQTSAFDLGNFDQAIWNTAHGRPFALTNIPDVTIRLAHHVEPILLLIAPLYWLWSDVRVLLILQSVALAAGALPLFWYAARRVGEGPALLFAALYLLFPALQGVNLFDFHAVALAPLFLLLAWSWLDERRDGPFLLAGLLAAATKEEISLLVAMMGLYALLIQRRRFGLLPFVAGVGWFLFVLEVISPAFNVAGQHEFMGFYGQWGDSALTVAFNLLTRPLALLDWLTDPVRLAYLRDLLTPTLGVSLLSPHILLIAAPSLAVNLLSSYPPMTVLEGFHYPAPIVPFVVVSAVAGSAWLSVRFKEPHQGRIRWALAGAMLLATLLYQRGHGATPLAAGWQWPIVTEHHRIGAALLATLPSEAAISAQSPINPHLSQRERIYRFPDEGDAELLVFDVTVSDLFFHPNDLRREIDERLASGAWGVQAARDGWLVLHRCGPDSRACSRTLPDEFYSYARAPAPAPQYRADVQFGDALRLHGYDWEPHPDGSRIRLYWEALRPIREPLRIELLFLAPDWATTLEEPTQGPLMEPVWYPPTQWQPGEIVQTTTLHWPLGSAWNLAVAVRGSQDARLPFTMRSNDTAPDAPRAAQRLLTLLRVRDGRVLAGSLRRFALPADFAPVGATLGDGLRLAGATHPRRARAGETLTLTLGWQAGDAPPPADYTAFVQLLGPAGLVTQSDAFPTTWLEGEPTPRPTTGWSAQEVILDQHTLTLPPDLPPGDYRLIAGLYDLAQGGARLPAALHGTPLPDNAMPLGTLRVE